jgi:hypothetical protein
MGVVTDLQPIAIFTVVADLGTVDEWGNWTTGTQTNLTFCHIEIGNDRVVDSNGNEAVSRGSVFSLEDNSLFPGINDSKQEYRFTLPSTWPKPRTNLRALNVHRNEDDEGEVYEEIIL